MTKSSHLRLGFFYQNPRRSRWSGEEFGNVSSRRAYLRVTAAVCLSADRRVFRGSILRANQRAMRTLLWALTGASLSGGLHPPPRVLQNHRGMNGCVRAPPPVRTDGLTAAGMGVTSPAAPSPIHGPLCPSGGFSALFKASVRGGKHKSIQERRQQRNNLQIKHFHTRLG